MRAAEGWEGRGWGRSVGIARRGRDACEQVVGVRVHVLFQRSQTCIPVQAKTSSQSLHSTQCTDTLTVADHPSHLQCCYAVELLCCRAVNSATRRMPVMLVRVLVCWFVEIARVTECDVAA